MLRNKPSSIVALSHLPPVTAPKFTVLQEARLMLMCHQRSLLKTRILRLSASTEVVLTDFRSQVGLAARWTVLSWSRVTLASIRIWQIQTFYFQHMLIPYKKKQTVFKLIFEITWFRPELSQISHFWSLGMKVNDGQPKYTFSSTGPSISVH